MNLFPDNPVFFFVDNAHPAFPTDFYTDTDKIVELADIGCDARSPLTSVRQPANQRVPGCKEELRTADKRSRHVEKESDDKATAKKRTKVIARESAPQEQKSRQSRDNSENRTRTFVDSLGESRDNDEQFANFIDAFDLLNMKARCNEDRAGTSSDSTKAIIDSSDEMNLSFDDIPQAFQGLQTFLRNEMKNDKNGSRDSLRAARKTAEEIAKEKKYRSKTQSPPRDRQKRTKIIEKDGEHCSSVDCSRETRKLVDRAVDRDSLSDTASSIDAKKNVSEKVCNNSEKAGGVNDRRQNSRSADFDQSKQRVLAMKRFANRAQSQVRTQQQERCSSADDGHLAKSRRARDESKCKEAKNSVSPSRQQQKKEERKDQENMENARQRERSVVRSSALNKEDTRPRFSNRFSVARERKSRGLRDSNKNAGHSDENSSRPSTAKSKTTVEKKSATDNSKETHSVRFRDRNNIDRKDIEKLGSILLSTTLKKASKFSKDACDRPKKSNERKEEEEKKEESKKHLSKADLNFIKRTVSHLKRKLEATESHDKMIHQEASNRKLFRSKIPIAINRFKTSCRKEDHRKGNENYENLEGSPPRESVRSRTKPKGNSNNGNNVTKVQTDAAVECVGKVEEATSIGTLNTKVDEKKVEENEIDKFDDFHEKGKGIGMKVLNMARATKEQQKREFAEYALHDRARKVRDELQEIVDIGVTVVEKGLTDNDASIYLDNLCVKRENNESGYGQHWPLRNTMYAGYFRTDFRS